VQTVAKKSIRIPEFWLKRKRAGEKILQVTIEGIPPGLLMNSSKAIVTVPKARAKVCIHGVSLDEPCKDCLELRAYRKQDGELYIPSEMLFAAIMNAATEWKRGKKSFTPSILAGSIDLWPEKISLGVKEYKVHEAIVRNPSTKGRVRRFRPWLPEWRATFLVKLNPMYGLTPEVLREMIEEAGTRVGIGDWRPQYKGRFGRFVVVEFKEVNPWRGKE